MHLAIYTAVEGVDQSIATAAGWMLKKCATQDAFASWCEHNVDGIVHAARHDRFNPAAVWASAEDMAGPGHERWFSRPWISLLRKSPFAPINPAIAPEVGAMQIVGTTG